jgi:hypothetical protein
MVLLENADTIGQELALNEYQTALDVAGAKAGAAYSRTQGQLRAGSLTGEAAFARFGGALQRRRVPRASQHVRDAGGGGAPGGHVQDRKLAPGRREQRDERLPPLRAPERGLPGLRVRDRLMPERLQLRLARVVESEPVRRYATVAETPTTCPRPGCTGLLRDWPEGRLCSACARIFVVDEVLSRRRVVKA